MYWFKGEKKTNHFCGDQLNSVLAYMALDMEAVEEPLLNELQRKKKMGSLVRVVISKWRGSQMSKWRLMRMSRLQNPSEGSLIARYGEDLISQFENAGEEVRMRYELCFDDAECCRTHLRDLGFS